MTQELIHYPSPIWLKLCFLAVIPTPMLMVSFLVRSVFRKQQRSKNFISTLAFFAIYTTYVILLGSIGFFNKVFFPPIVLLLTTLPFACILFLYIAKTERFALFIQNVSLYQLISIHIFRLIGLFFILLALYDILPKWFALIAGTGDILTAVSSIWISKYANKQRPNYRSIVWLWNTFGLVDILFTAVSANVLTKLSIDRGIMGVDTLAMFPFYLIPAIAPPLIIFLHYCTYLKLREDNV